MNWKTVLLALVLVDFSVLSALAIAEVGYLGIFRAGLANWGTAQILADLVIACVLAMLWMRADARARGLNSWPYIVLTVLAGSFGPLCYLLRREWKTAPRTRLASLG
ncbi:MAG: DUF2834 domain-containing protein [Gammaproteobacteria bacterium]|nr:DUF2834 domain-containing protein [Gammaproteobacteria bacterium]